MRIKQFICIWILLKDVIKCAKTVPTDVPNVPKNFWICAQSHSSKICFRVTKYSSISCNGRSSKLTCGTDNVIMVNTIRYSKSEKVRGPESCSRCSNANIIQPDWDINPISFKTKLYQRCSLQNQCSIGALADIEKPTNDQDYLWYADVSFDCVRAALIHDMCMPWETTSLSESSLHITTNSSSIDGGYCSCIINGHADILVVDYRPYYNDAGCSDAIFLIDRVQKFECTTTTSSDKSVYNRQIDVTHEETNLTLLFFNLDPQMAWIRIKDYTSVQCNVDQGTEAVSSTTKTTSTTTRTTRTTTTTTTTTTRGTVTIPSLTQTSHTESPKDSNTAVSAIVGGTVGGVAGVVVVVLVVYFLCKRRTYRKNKTKKKENTYNAVGVEAKGTQKVNIINGMINKSYEDGGEMIDITPNSASNYQEIDTNNVYSEPVDAVADDNYTEPKETDANIQNLHAVRDEDMFHNYREPYDKALLTRDNGDKTNYNEVMKGDEKNDAYNTLDAVDNYSHIHIITDRKVPDHLDNYSHIKVGQSEDHRITQERSADVYSHLEEDTNQQNVSDNLTYTGKLRNHIDTEEYDHLHVADILHH